MNVLEGKVMVALTDGTRNTFRDSLTNQLVDYRRLQRHGSLAGKNETPAVKLLHTPWPASI